MKFRPKVSITLVLVLLAIGGNAFAGPFVFGQIGTTGSVQSGTDPLGFANTPFDTEGTIDSAATGASCGASCEQYTPTSLFIEFNNNPSQLYAVSSPTLTIQYNPGSDSSFAFAGLILVGSTNTFFDVHAGLANGTITASSLTNPPMFPSTAIDSTSPLSGFTYTAGGGTTLGPDSGTAFAGSSVPEPGAFWMMGAGLTLIVPLRRRLSRLL